MDSAHVMDGPQIVAALRGVAPDGAVEAAPAADGMPAIYVAREHIEAVCTALRDLPALQFAFAADVTGVDYMPREPRFEIVYTLASLGIGGFGDTPKRLRVKVRLPGTDPRMPTVSRVWKSMDWGEREVYDLFGVHFDGHPDLRRILMPEDWEGYPARKDYPVQIKMKPKVYEPIQLTPEEFAANMKQDRERAGRS
jgi:NADH-quinone oxidoreductase subunit C